MKKEQVNSILVIQTKRRNTFVKYLIAIILVFAMMILSFATYTKKSEQQYVSYDKNSDIYYQVVYKENEFFDTNYIDANKQYIASLIDTVKSEFTYEISLDDYDVEYKYAYKVETNVVIKDKDTKKLFYDETELLFSEPEKVTNEKKVVISEKININYDQYNDKIKKMVAVYDLKNVESYLNINMYVSVSGNCDGLAVNQNQDDVITLSIPLSQDTLAIEFVDNVVSSENSVMVCDADVKNAILFLALSILLALMDIILVISMIKYEIDTRTAETIYEKEVKKILNNYGSNIQMLGNEFDFEGYQLLKIAEFDDMLEISDKLRQPILMKENLTKTGAYFLIPSTTKLLYVYRLKVSSIKRKMQKDKS